MGTATSSERCASAADRPALKSSIRAIAAGALAAIALAGCGGGSSRSGFGWVHPAADPAGWTVVRLAGGATFAYPPGWRAIHGDPGTASAAAYSAGRLIGYLNLTPGDPNETLSSWARFRPDHNAEEGEHHVKTTATGTGLRFRTGAGSCVQDSYTTDTGNHYIELACLVSGAGRDVVIVGAATPGSWARIAPLLKRSLSSVTA
jgi:hypothetical protein